MKRGSHGASSSIESLAEDGGLAAVFRPRHRAAGLLRGDDADGRERELGERRHGEQQRDDGQPGPAGTAGVGICKAGTHVCNGQGTAYGACSGEVLPQAETCNTAADDNCNGQVNEGGVGCVCTPNATASFGGPVLTSAGGNDIVVAKYSSSGAYLWAKSFGDIASQGLKGLTTDSLGDELFTGLLYGPTDFGGGAVIGAGGEDTFIAKLSP